MRRPLHWVEGLGLRTITGRTFQADNVFHKVLAQLHGEISFMLLRATGARRILTDLGHFGLTDYFPPHLAEQLNVYRFELGPLSDSLRDRLSGAVSEVIWFWRDCGRIWSNASFIESLNQTEDIDADTRGLCVVAACLLCLDRALAHCDRGHVWKAVDWLDSAQWLRFVLVTWREAELFQTILTKLLQQSDEARARTRNLSERRHAKTREAREKVLHDWEKEPSRFRSAEKAGAYYSDWLVKQDCKRFETRTVADWIREHARLRGIKLR